jgi:hypothetical protein
MAKDKRTARDFLNWCGWFVSPDQDPDLFKTLPGWRQREVTFVRECRAKGHEPTPADLRCVREGIPTDGTPLTIPSSLTLASLRRHVGGIPVDDYLIATLMLTVTPESVIRHCTGGGEGTQLATTKPVHGVQAFVWLLTMIRRGAIEAIPLTAFWDLEESIHAETGAVVSTRRDGPLLAWLDGLSADLHAMVL